jgi:hypothetical protein
VNALDPVQLAAARAIGIVGDRAHAAGLCAAVEKMGGGWHAGAQLWRGQRVEFLLLLADKPSLYQRRAPLVVTAAALPPLMRFACTRLNDVTCFWAMFLAPEAEKTARDCILADSVVEGRA